MSIEIKQRPSIFAEPPGAVKALVVRSGSNDMNVAIAAQRELAKALEIPLRKGILAGNVLFDIFQAMPLAPDAAPEFPLDILAPGVEKEHVAYAIPAHGSLPERCVEGDYIMIPTYEIGSSIDWPLKLARNSRWDIVARAMEIFEAGFVKKKNNDGWHTILAAAADRKLVVYDGNAGAGRFTVRLISLMNQAMRRNAGGNTTSLTRGRLTDMFLSVEALEDMRNWSLGDVPEAVRTQIFQSADGYVTTMLNVKLHDMIEFGVGQEYQNYWTDSGSLNMPLAPGDVELVVGLDLQRNDSFVMPTKGEMEVYEDPTLFMQRRAGFKGWQELGFAVVDNRRVIAASL